MSMEAKTFKTNVNARDAKGWNALAIASFRHCFNALRVLLAEGGDPHAKNQYGMSAVDFAQDELDAAMRLGGAGIHLCRNCIVPQLPQTAVCTMSQPHTRVSGQH